MYKVLLVEDEAIVRVALKSLIDWQANGFDLKFEATNGKQALEILEQYPDIDIVITDINMPIMDGISLIKEIQNSSLDPSIIVLSAYDDYSIVRNAFKLGAYDYIVKSEMDTDEILNLLRKIKDHKEENTKKLTTTYSRFEKAIFLKEILEETDIDKIQFIKKRYQVQINRKNIVVCSLLIDNFESVKERYQQDNLNSFSKGIVEIVVQVLEKVENSEFIIISPNEYALIVCFDENSELIIYEQIEQVLMHIRHNVFHYMDITFSAGISYIFSGLEELKDIYTEALANAKYRFVLGKGKNIYSKDIVRINKCQKENITQFKDILIEGLNENNKDKIMKGLKDILDKVDVGREVEKNEITAYYMELLYTIIYFLNENSYEKKNIFEHNTNFLSKVYTFDTKVEMDKWIYNLVGNLIDYMLDCLDHHNSPIIKRAKEYVQLNYMKKITLLEISEHLNLSEGYFSGFFTQKEGENFSQYLTKYRIEKAKNLLKYSDQKIYEICSAVGYENVEHFSRIFKKIVSTSPKRYRNNSKHIR